MVSRFGLRPLLVCSALLAASQLGFGQVKVAVVNMQQAVLGSAEINKANEDMQATFKPRQDKITQLQNEGQAEVDQLQKNESKMTQQQVSDMQYDIQKKQRELKNLQDDLQTDVDAYRNDILQKSSVKMSEVVKKLAEEKGIDVVVEAQTAIYFKPALDITKDAIAAYDKAYPAKAAAPAPPAAK
jgi:outer membrane protein